MGIPFVLVLLIGCQSAACSSSRYYIRPVDENFKSKEVAVLKVEDQEKISVDDNDVTGIDLVYMTPGWHHISFGWSQTKGCAQWKTTHYSSRYAWIGVKVPGSDRYQRECIRNREDFVSFSGWWEFPADQKIYWADIREKLKTTQSHRDIIDELADSYERGDAEIRKDVVQRLGDIQNSRVIVILRKALEDKDDAVKIAACRSATKINNRYGIAAWIRELIKTTNNGAVKSAAEDALESLTGSGR